MGIRILLIFLSICWMFGVSVIRFVCVVVRVCVGGLFARSISCFGFLLLWYLGWLLSCVFIFFLSVNC